jgi:hypothetical protein
MLASRIIGRLISPESAAILFVPMPNGTLWLCSNYQGLNKGNLKNRCPGPLMSGLRKRPSKAKFLTMLDLKDGLYLIRMARGEE